MKNEKEVKISYLAAHLTTIVSVTLVLLIVGVIAMISIGASTESKRLRERLEVSVVMADSVSDSGARTLARQIAASPYALSVGVVTKEAALINWKKDTGEDLESLFGVNPLSPEVTFTVKGEYASEKSLAGIGVSLRSQPGVEAVALPDSAMVENMNRNIERFSLVLGIIALVLIVISFVLINNTVHLSTYARRFTIHTMQLVGATNSFIRRPFILNNMVSGLVAGLVASAILALALVAAPHGGFDDVASYISWRYFSVVAAGLVLAGMAICGLSSWIATSRFLRKDYGQLFR